MRELVATLYGNELLFGLALAAWLVWVAVGSSPGGLARFLPPLSSSPQTKGTGRKLFTAGLALAAVLLPAQIALVRGVRALLGVTPGALVEFGPMVGVVFLILAPLCLLMGLLFTLGAQLTVQRGGGAGQAYTWESAGGAIGGALFGLILVHRLDPFQIALFASAVNLTVALYTAAHLCTRTLVSSLALMLLCSFPLGHYLHTTTLRWQWSDLVFAADSPYGRITVQANEGQRVFFENGLLAFETQGTFSEEVTHFPLLAHPDPREVLLIGGGVGGDVREILKHPSANVTYVELDPSLIEAARAFLPPEDAAVLDDSRVTLVLSDGRRYVKTARHQNGCSQKLMACHQNGCIEKLMACHQNGCIEKLMACHQNGRSEKLMACRTFDVIILDLPEPSTGALNRFYTFEFFADVRAMLAPNGVFALGLPSAENYWSQELARRNGSVYHTLRAVFPEVVVLPGEHNFFLASGARLETDPVVLAERLSERGIETRRVTPGYIEYVFTSGRFAAVQAELAAAGGRLNRDLTPICYYYNLTLWLSRFYPNLRGTFESASLVNLWWAAAPLALLVLLARLRRRWAIPLAIAAIGLAQMTLEVVILFAFQVLHGTVYVEVSLIVTAFMAGLALGSAAGHRAAARPGGRKRALAGVMGGVVVYSGVLPLVFSLPISTPTLAFPLLAMAAGFLAGMAFPLAVALTPGSASRAAGSLYGADLVGGCVGAVAGAVFLVPVLGIPQTCAVVALAGLAGLLALL